MTAVLDAHVHIWDRATDPQAWIDPTSMGVIDRDFSVADMATMLDASGAPCGIMVQSSNSAPETRRLLATTSPRVAGVVGWVDLGGDVAGQLSAIPAADSARLVGIRHLVHIDPDTAWLLRADVGRGLAALGAHRLVFDLVVRASQLGQVDTVVGRHPDTTFVIDHLGAPPIGSDDLPTWASQLRAVARHPNVAIKVSGLPSAYGSDAWEPVTFRDVFDVALNAFGPHRMMYGSDWPLVELGGGAGRWADCVRTLTAELSTQELSSIWHGCATRTYNLEEAS